MAVFHDSAGGVTSESLKFWRATKPKLGTILSIACGSHSDVEYNTMVTGTDGVALLSGFGCGYSGTGPMGLVELLFDLGFKDVARNVIVNKCVFYVTPEARAR
jgi:hypothetical protein